MAVAGSLLSVRAQEGWYPAGEPNWTGMSFITTGGITYFQYSASLQGCSRVAAESPVSRNGTNNVLYQTISQELWIGVCICDPVENPCDHSETHVSVLGALAPGDYVFRISSKQGLNPPTDSHWVSFSAPNQDKPTLSCWADTNANAFKLAVEGVSNVTYVVQISADLTNWTSVATNVGGPFVWSEPMNRGTPNRFYRTWIIGN